MGRYGAGGAVVAGAAGAVDAGVDAADTVGAEVAGARDVLAASVGGFVRTATIPENKLYGQPSGRSVGTGGKSRIDCRISPGST